jgi:hypothetical protein
MNRLIKSRTCLCFFVRVGTLHLHPHPMLSSMDNEPLSLRNGLAIAAYLHD